MWNPIKAIQDAREAKNVEYERQARQQRQEQQARRETIRAQIKKEDEAYVAWAAKQNAPMVEAHNAALKAARDAEEARQADVLAKALINNGIMNLGNGTVNVTDSVYGPGATKDIPGAGRTAPEPPAPKPTRPTQERKVESRESGNTGGVVNRGGDLDISGQAIGYGSSITTWGAESPKAEADWGGWDTSSLDSSLDSSVATYNTSGPELSL